MTGHTPSSLGHRIVRASMAVGLAHLLFKLAGLIQAKVMGHYLPREAFDVMYAFAFENCIFSIFLVGEEVIGPACLPVFMRELDQEHGERPAWRFASTLLTLQALFLAVLVAALMLFPGVVVRIWTAWSPTNHPALFDLGSHSVRHLAPALLALSLGSTTYILLNAYKRFFLAAFGDAVWKFAVVAALLAGTALLGGRTGQLLLIGLVAGSLLKLATHLYGLRDKLHLLRPRWAPADPALRRMLWLALPLLAGIVFAKVRDAFNHVYVLSELDSAGLMQANSMGRKLQSTLHTLVPYTLSIAVFPFFCELVDRNDRQKLAEVVTHAGRLLMAVFIPFTAIVCVLATPLTALVFRGGQFDDLAVSRTAISTACYTLALPAAAIEALVMQAFFAHRRMVAVTIAGIGFSALSMGFSWLGLQLSGGRELVVLAAIAGGFALTRTLKSFTLVHLLQTSTPAFPFRSTAIFLLRSGLVAMVAAAATWAGVRAANWLPLPDDGANGRLLSLARIVTGGAAGFVGATGGCLLLRVTEPFEMVRWVLARLRNRKPEAARPPR